MAFRFEDLKVWHKAVDLSNEIDLLSRKFPKTELYNLCSLIKRAADSQRAVLVKPYPNSKDFWILHCGRLLKL